MNCLQKKFFSVLILLCIGLVFITCSPDPDPPVPTETIVIKGIPAQIEIDGSNKATFKVYVQLSSGTSAAGGYAALGSAKGAGLVTEADGTITATINELIGAPGWNGTNWANECVVIRPLAVSSKYDIVVRVGRTGPGTSSTVYLGWGSLMKVATGGGGLISEDDYQLLYNDIIVGDPNDPPTF